MGAGMAMDYRAVQDKVVIPLLIVMVTGIGTWALNIDRTVAENSKDIEFTQDEKTAIKNLLEAAQAKQDVMTQQTHDIEKQMIEIRMTQEGFDEDITEIKDQTKLILEALRERN